MVAESWDSYDGPPSHGHTHDVDESCVSVEDMSDAEKTESAIDGEWRLAHHTESKRGKKVPFEGENLDR